MGTLYKYRGLGKRTEEIFTTRRVWLAQPSSLNDPLDCTLEEFETAERARLRRETMRQQLEGFILVAVRARRSRENFFGLQAQDIHRLLKRIGRPEKSKGSTAELMTSC